MDERDPSWQKVSFRLERDEDGYPPADWEHLWGKRVGESLFELDNIAFFVMGVSLGDVVLAEQSGDFLCFREVIRPSANSTLHIVFFDRTKLEEVRSDLKKMGCSSELSHLSNLIAVNVPTTTDLDDVLSYLATRIEKGTSVRV